MMKEYFVCIPSKGRAGKVSSLGLFYDPLLFVPSDEYEGYIQEYGDSVTIISVPLTVAGITATRNFILDWVKNRGVENHIQVDDDAKEFYVIEKGEYIRFSDKDKIDWIIRQMFLTAEEWGAYLWGLNMAMDRRFYRVYSPFSTLTVIAGNLLGIRENPLRFDERLKVKEDYDYSLSHLHRYRKAIKFLKYGLLVDHLSNAGGCVDTRTMEVEKEAYEVLKKKWGGEIIKWQKNRNFVRVNSPLKGI